jgi:hypothetical protein
MNKLTTLLIACAFLLPGCGQETVSSSSPEHAGGPSFADIYAAAEQALAIAEAKRNVWSRTEGLLRDAKAAHADGHIVEAVALATEAKLQAELASVQADTEADAWRTRVLSN